MKINGKLDNSISVYHRIFSGYTKGENVSNERLIVEGNDIYYLFPIEKRESDREYYKKLKEEKVNKYKQLR